MIEPFIARELPPEQDGRAIALLRLSDEDLGEEDWAAEIRTYRQAADEGSGGIASIEDARQFILGLCFFRIAPGAECERVLEIHRLVVPDTVAPLIARVFMSVVEDFARAAGCDAIHVPAGYEPAFHAGAMRSLLEAEFAAVDPHWCHKVRAAPQGN